MSGGCSWFSDGPARRFLLRAAAFRTKALLGIEVRPDELSLVLDTHVGLDVRFGDFPVVRYGYGEFLEWLLVHRTPDAALGAMFAEWGGIFPLACGVQSREEADLAMSSVGM